MPPKPCVLCGQPKKTGHPRWCPECWLDKQALEVRKAEVLRSRVLMQVRLDAAGMEKLSRPPRETWPTGRKWCQSCFRFLRDQGFSGEQTQCRTCSLMKGHEGRVKREYGMQPGEYDAMLKLQGGVCAICQRSQKIKQLAVHHDHNDPEKKAIALLCQRCNHELLGAAFDSPNILLCAFALQAGGYPAVQSVLNGGGWKGLAAYLAENDPDEPTY